VSLFGSTSGVFAILCRPRVHARSMPTQGEFEPRGVDGEPPVRTGPVLRAADVVLAAGDDAVVQLENEFRTRPGDARVAGASSNARFSIGTGLDVVEVARNSTGVAVR